MIVNRKPCHLKAVHPSKAKNQRAFRHENVQAEVNRYKLWKKTNGKRPTIRENLSLELRNKLKGECADPNISVSTVTHAGSAMDPINRSGRVIHSTGRLIHQKQTANSLTNQKERMSTVHQIRRLRHEVRKKNTNHVDSFVAMYQNAMKESGPMNARLTRMDAFYRSRFMSVSQEKNHRKPFLRDEEKKTTILVRRRERQLKRKSIQVKEIHRRERQKPVLDSSKLQKTIQTVKTGTGLIVKKEALRGTRNAVRNTLHSEDTTDSSMGGVDVTARTTAGIIDSAQTVRKAVHNAKTVQRYLKKKKTQSQAKKVAAKQANRKMAATTAKQTMKITAKGAAAITKVIASNPISLVIVAVIVAVCVLLAAISSINSGVGQIPTNVIMADENTMQSYLDEMNRLNRKFQEQIERYQNSPMYDDVVIEYMGEMGATQMNWQEILALMAVEQDQDLRFTKKEKDRLDELFDLMNEIRTSSEEYKCGKEGCTKRHLRLCIQIYTRSLEEMMESLEYTEDEKEWARQLATFDLTELYPNLTLPGISGLPESSLSPEEIRRLMESAPTTDVTREKIRQTALSLVGKVPYFWGGKSPAGWNDKWNTSVLVTAGGNETTGTYQPYGLDCSGFTDWVYKTAGVGNMLSAGGSAYQWKQSYAISASDLKPGDLVFMQPPNAGGVNHVGLFVGYDSKGGKLYCHCEWGSGVTVNGFKGFKYFRRPYVNFKD